MGSVCVCVYICLCVYYLCVLLAYVFGTLIMLWSVSLLLYVSLNSTIPHTNTHTQTHSAIHTCTLTHTHTYMQTIIEQERLRGNAASSSEGLRAMQSYMDDELQWILDRLCSFQASLEVAVVVSSLPFGKRVVCEMVSSPVRIVSGSVASGNKTRAVLCGGCGGQQLSK